MWPKQAREPSGRSWRLGWYRLLGRPSISNQFSPPVGGAGVGLVPAGPHQQVAGQADEGLRQKAPLGIGGGIGGSAPADGEQGAVDEPLPLPADDLPGRRGGLDVPRQEQQRAVRQLRRVVLVGPDAGEDVVGAGVVDAVAAVEEKGLDLVQVGLPGQHGVPGGPGPAGAPGGAVEAGQQQKGAVPQAADPPQVGGAALQQLGHVLPGGPPVPALPDQDAVAAAGTGGVLPWGLQAHDAPVGEADAAEGPLLYGTAAGLPVGLPAVLGEHVDPEGALVPAAALHGAVGHRRANGLAVLQEGRAVVRVPGLQGLLEAQTQAAVAVVEGRRPGGEAGALLGEVEGAALVVEGESALLRECHGSNLRNFVILP